MDADRYKQTKALFLEALDLQEDERARFLSRVRTDDPALHAEVVSLLEQESEEEFLEPLISAHDLVAASGQREPRAETDPLLEQEVSGYRVIRRLGEGGMGVVYLADDVRLRRRVALKFLRSDLLVDDKAMARFAVEARAGAALDHPNLCTVFDIVKTPEGDVFLVLAYYEGVTVRDRLRDGPLPWRESLEIAKQVGVGLAAAHAAGIVHRDIKPGNVMLVDGQVRVLDFGIAKIVDQTTLTMRGATLGTVAYISPEQAEGAKIDHRTDVWSLGVVLYEMITGRQPFKVKGGLGLSRQDRWGALRPLDGACGESSDRIERLIVRALALEADDRYPSMQAFVRAIEEAQSSGSVVSDEPSLVDFQRQLARLELGEDHALEQIEIMAVAIAASDAIDAQARREAARVLFFAGARVESVHAFDLLLRATPDDAILRLDQAVALAKNEQGARAIVACEAALESEEGRSLLAAAFGNAAKSKEDLAGYDRAREFVTALGNRFPDALALLDLRFGEAAFSLEYFDATRRVPDLRTFLAFRRLGGSLAGLVDRVGLVAYAGFDESLAPLMSAPSARSLVRP